MMQEMNWATAQIILQEFNCIAIGGRLINLRKYIAIKRVVLQVGLAGEAGCVTIQTLYRDCCYLNRKVLYCKT